MNPGEWSDADGDGVGDNEQGWSDWDGDGVPNDSDDLPYDASEVTDSDGDGVGDNSDWAPGDSSESADSDGDGVGDNADAFPNDSTETSDVDGDGLGDNADTDSACTDEDACNYNNSSTVNSVNVNCIYPDAAACETCSGEQDGTGTI